MDVPNSIMLGRVFLQNDFSNDDGVSRRQPARQTVHWGVERGKPEIVRVSNHAFERTPKASCVHIGVLVNEGVSSADCQQMKTLQSRCIAK